MSKYFFVASLILVMASCNQSKEKKPVVDQIVKDTVTAVQESVAAEQPAMIQFGGEGQKIVVPADHPSYIQGKKGLKITVDPAALETTDGSPLGKEIDIELKEMSNQQDLFDNNAATISDGQLLVSGGAYYIGMSSGGKPVKLKSGRTLLVEIPKISDKEMELFYGQRDSSGKLNWKPAGKKIIVPEKTTVQITAPAAVTTPVVTKTSVKKDPGTKAISDLLTDTTIKKGRMSATDFKNYISSGSIPEESDVATQKIIEVKDSVTGKKVKKLESVYYRPLEIQNLGWINCDRFYNSPNKVPVQCEFDSSLVSPSATIYVIFKNINSLLSESIAVQKGGGTRNLSTLLPAGEPVNIIAVTNQKGKLYSFKKSFIAGDGQVLKMQFNPVEEKDLSKHLYNIK